SNLRKPLMYNATSVSHSSSARRLRWRGCLERAFPIVALLVLSSHARAGLLSATGVTGQGGVVVQGNGGPAIVSYSAQLFTQTSGSGWVELDLYNTTTGELVGSGQRVSFSGPGSINLAGATVIPSLPPGEQNLYASWSSVGLDLTGLLGNVNA